MKKIVESGKKPPKKTNQKAKSKKNPEELQKLKNFYLVLETLTKEADPFTTETLENTLQKVSKWHPDSQTLFQEFMGEPQKVPKRNSYAGFAESKRKFDLLCDKEDTQQTQLASERFRIYHSHLEVAESTWSALNLLGKARIKRTREERRHLILEAMQIPKVQKQTDCNNSEVLREVLALDPPRETLSLAEKLKLLRGVSKHLGDWDKILKEFKNTPKDLEILKHAWRCLKGTMRQEVCSIKQRAPSYHCIKWLRAAVKKLETQLGKRKVKLPALIDATQPQRRLDILSLMVEAENLKQGIQGDSNLPFSSTSCFKPFRQEFLESSK